MQSVQGPVFSYGTKTGNHHFASPNLVSFTSFSVETVDGTAESGSDYIPVKKSMVFEPDETTQDLEIEIVDDNIWEPDEVFFVRISVEPDQKCVIGKRGICQVVILNDDGKHSHTYSPSPTPPPSPASPTPWLGR